MVKAQLVLLAIASLVAPSPWASGTGGDGGDVSTALSSFVPSKWDYVIPNETPLAFAAGPDGGLMIPVPHKGGKGFLVEVDGAALAVDANGDGKVDQRVKGVAGNVVLKGTTEAGTALVYGVRILMHNGKWHYLPGSVMQGKLLGQDIKLIDLNGNGRFDEFGVDAMIFGRGSAASYLSKVVSTAGKLHEVSFDANGTSVNATPWSGETGTLNLASGFKVDGNLSSAVVLSEKDNFSFELSGYKSGLLIPAGDYRFMYGFVRNGAEQSKIETGNSKPIPVPASKTTVLTWGSPLAIEFNYTVTKDRLSVPIDIHFFGNLGEEYYDFKPDALSPRIVVYDRKTREKLTEGRFGGC